MTASGRSHPLILIIDDDHDLVETLTDALEIAGNYAVACAYDGAAGLDAVVSTRPDCVVVDVRMPALNGLHFVRVMRGDPATRNIPIVIISALVQDPDLEVGLLSGADIYLRKPVRMTDLLSAIEHSLAVTMDQRASRWREMADALEEDVADDS